MAILGIEKPQVNFLTPQFFNPLFDGGRGPKILLKMCIATRPLRSDHAAELREWTRDQSPSELVFDVPAGLIRILNRDLVAAGIEKLTNAAEKYLFASGTR